MVTHVGITQKFKMAAVKPEIHLSTFVHGIYKLLYIIATKFQRLYPCFWGWVTRRDWLEYCLMCEYVVYQRWRPLTGSRYEITHITARIHDSNKISTATPTFSRSSNYMELVSILPDVNGSRKSKMAAVKPEVLVSQLVDLIESKFQRHLLCFWGWPTQWH